MTEAAWDAVVDTQLRGTFNSCRFAAEPMKAQGRGKILITGSVESLVALPKNVHYVAAMHGMLGVTKALAIDLAPHGINVNMVCPGAIETHMSAGMGVALTVDAGFTLK